jgi:flagellar basal-body rod protein FlgG
MNRALYTATTGMNAQQFQIDTIANNTANLRTPAYKKQNVETADLFYQHFNRAGNNGDNITIPCGIYVGAGVKVQGVSRDLSPGYLKETKNDLHMAIIGRGYFVIEMPDGTLAYTRAGNFEENKDGVIVTHDGYTVSPGITIPPDSSNLTISKDGTVSVLTPGNIDPQQIGQLEIVSFVNEAGLEAQGSNLYLETEQSGPATEGIADENGFGYILHRWIEESNVEITSELTNLVTAHRAFETVSKIIQVADDMLKTVNQIKT